MISWVQNLHPPTGPSTRAGTFAAWLDVPADAPAGTRMEPWMARQAKGPGIMRRAWSNHFASDPGFTPPAWALDLLYKDDE